MASKKRTTKKKSTKQSSAKRGAAKSARTRTSTAKQARPKVKAKRGGTRPRDTPKEISVFDPDRVMEVLDVMPDDEQLSTAADMISGLAHQSRLKAIIALSMHELCVGDISAIVGLSLSATSTLLKQLRGLGYVTARGAGKQTYYRVQGDLPEAILGTVFSAIDARN